MAIHKNKRKVAKATTTLLNNLITKLTDTISSDIFTYKSKLVEDNLTIGQRLYTIEYISSNVILITPSKAYKPDNSYGLELPLTLTFTCVDRAYDYLTDHLE